MNGDAHHAGRHLVLACCAVAYDFLVFSLGVIARNELQEFYKQVERNVWNSYNSDVSCHQY